MMKLLLKKLRILFILICLVTPFYSCGTVGLNPEAGDFFDEDIDEAPGDVNPHFPGGDDLDENEDVAVPVDADGDEYLSDEDCDDDDANNYPGNAEVCDGQDNDCDDLSDEDFVDSDGDGIGDDCDDDAIVPSITQLKVNNDCVIPMSSVTLSWNTQNAEEVYLDDVLVEPNDSQIVQVSSDTTYTLKAVNGEESVRKEVSVYVKEASTVYETFAESFDEGDIQDIRASSDGTLLVLADNKVYKGNYDGSFSRLRPNSSVSSYNVIAMDPEDSSVMYAGKTGRIYRSSNGGNSFPDVIPVRRNGSDLNPNVVYVSHANANKVFIGFDGGLFVLSVSAGTLDYVDDQDIVGQNIKHFVANEDYVVAATHSKIFVSSNNGNGWSPKDAEDWSRINSLRIFNDTLYVSTNQGLFKTDATRLSNPSWEKFESLDQGAVYDVLGKRGTYAATENGVYQKSGNGWIKVISDETLWLIDDNGLVAVTETDFLTYQQTVEYSTNCPGKSAISSRRSDFITTDFIHILDRLQ